MRRSSLGGIITVGYMGGPAACGVVSSDGNITRSARPAAPPTNTHCIKSLKV
jgi:hypothetical protein